MGKAEIGANRPPCKVKSTGGILDLALFQAEPQYPLWG